MKSKKDQRNDNNEGMNLIIIVISVLVDLGLTRQKVEAPKCTRM